jgi:hypothetical protein
MKRILSGFGALHLNRPNYCGAIVMVCILTGEALNAAKVTVRCTSTFKDDLLRIWCGCDEPSSIIGNGCIVFFCAPLFT